MRRLVALLVVAVAALVATGAAQAAGGGVAAGFYRGKSIRYLDFGPIKLARGNQVAPIWIVENGTKAQRNVIDVVPGQEGYTPLWRVTMVSWKAGVKPRTLRSASAVRAAARAGQVKLERTKVVVNCPVLGFGQAKTAGFYRGESIRYLDLGPVKLAPGNQVAPIWTFPNGAEGQANIIDLAPGDEGYTPLWSVEMVTWSGGVTPRLLRSRADVQAAVAAGEVTIEKTPVVVNCPVVT